MFLSQPCLFSSFSNRSIKIIALLLLFSYEISFTSLIFASSSSNLTRIKIFDNHISAIQEIQGTIWIGGSSGLWRIAQDGKPEKIKEISLVHEIQEIQGTIWVIVFGGLWRIAQDEKPEKVMLSGVKHIQEIQGTIWIGLYGWLFRIAHDEKPEMIIDSDIKEIQEIHGTIWIGGSGYLGRSGGLWRIAHDEKPEMIIDSDIKEIQEIHDKIWVGGDEGLWRIAHDEKPEKIIDSDIKEIQEIHGKIWVGGDEGLWRIAHDEKPEKITESRVLGIQEIHGTIWVRGYGELWRIDQDEKPEKVMLSGVTHIQEIQGTIWVGGSSGLWRIDQDEKPERVLGDNIEEIQKIQGTIWVRVRNGLWRIAQDEKPEKVISGDIREFQEIQGAIWVGTINGIYKIYPFKVTVRTKNNDQILSKVESIFPKLWIGGYRNLSIKLIDPKTDEILFDFNEQHSFKPESYWGLEKTEIKEYPTSILRADGWGLKSIKYDIKDEWFNHFRNSPNEFVGIVIPGPVIWPFIIVIFWFLIFASLFLFCPWSMLAQNILMNPFWRGVGFLGFFPLVVSTFSIVRRHVLKRYYKSIYLEIKENELLKNYIDLPGEFEPLNFAKMNLKPSSVLIRGVSGVGKSAFLYRFIEIIIKNVNYKKRWIPVLITSISYQKESIETAVYNELKRLGQITDMELTKQLLNQGGFILLIDGLNEVDDNRVAEIANQSRSYSGTNMVVFTNQVRHEKLQNIPLFQMTPFQKKEIKKFLENEMGNEAGAKVFNSITDQMIPILSNPRNLTTFVQIHKVGKEWPGQTEVELYKLLFETFLDNWKHPGATDDYANLLKLAYKSWSEQLPKFEAKELTEDAKTDLRDYQIIVQRGNEWSFAHDRLRAYLVTEILVQEWETEPFDKINSNWLVPLQLLAEGFDNAGDAKILCGKVLKKNTEIAEQIFSHLKKIKPNQVKPWEKDFYSKLGEKRINHIT